MVGCHWSCSGADGSVNVLMETPKGGRNKPSCDSNQYEGPPGYSIEDIRPNDGIEKVHSAAYSNVSSSSPASFLTCFLNPIQSSSSHSFPLAVCKEAILINLEQQWLLLHLPFLQQYSKVRPVFDFSPFSFPFKNPFSLPLATRRRS